mmetsp:Transcript_17357/g.19443  ORF Transcript_17357/g.19443 Transcript_17357/m.19443 type:complete len:166 (-) Transcript_17357:971-1468(-)
MEFSIEQVSSNPGLDSLSSHPPAPKSATNRLGTASVHFDDLPPQMNKRIIKSNNKEFMENIKCAPNDLVRDDRDLGSDPQNTQPEFKIFMPTVLSSNCTKRRKITEDSNDWNESQFSNANFSTISHSDLERKAKSYNNEPLDFHSENNNSPTPLTSRKLGEDSQR